MIMQKCPEANAMTLSLFMQTLSKTKQKQSKNVFSSLQGYEVYMILKIFYCTHKHTFLQWSVRWGSHWAGVEPELT